MSQFHEQSETFLPAHEFIPTAWQSVPGAVRFAVWLWAIGVIVGFVVAVVMAVAFLLGAGFALS
jgi:ABC-type arginine/histidine transport system permease subunit